MTDITGNFGINSNSYGKEVKADTARVNKECSKEHSETEAPKEKTNLNSDPASVSGRSLVKTGSASAKKGDYEFNPKNVENDVREFQALYAVKEVTDDYKAELIKKGYSEKAAAEKAFNFAKCLIDGLNE